MATQKSETTGPKLKKPVANKRLTRFEFDHKIAHEITFDHPIAQTGFG
jgi:hypothetical protein